MGKTKNNDGAWISNAGEVDGPPGQQLGTGSATTGRPGTYHEQGSDWSENCGKHHVETRGMMF